MSKYGKFMKDILRNKKKLDDHETLMLNECSTILLNKLPRKLKDPESFSIPCNIENCQFEKLYVILELALTLCLYLFSENLAQKKQR